ncbi:MAG: hypothetical protein QM599_00090 [Pseudoxanthomonas sp.]
MDMSLGEVRELFDRAEAENDFSRKASLFGEALDVADDHLAEQSGGNDELVIGNLRKTHVRKLLAQLGEVREVDMLVWLDYIKLLVLRCEAEVNAVLADEVALKESYWKFKDMHRDELIMLVQRAK